MNRNTESYVINVYKAVDIDGLIQDKPYDPCTRHQRKYSSPCINPMGASAYAGMFSAESVRRGKHRLQHNWLYFRDKKEEEKGVPITSVLFNLKPL